MTTESSVPENRISEMFRGRTVLISGGTGFLGKVLIEKLLRSTEVKNVYLLVRTKKGKAPEERLADIFNNMLFDVLKAQKPDAIKKVQIISGDVTEVDLALSPENRNLLQNQVEFIYHAAATTRFDDSVQTATRMNTRGTKYMLDLAGECKKLKIFVHVSTAYAYPKEKVLYQKAYKPPANPHEVINSINWVKEDEMVTKRELLTYVIKKLGACANTFNQWRNNIDNEAITCDTGDCPNSYTFSKALAEGLVVEQMDKLPAIIVRPSIICPIIKEPLPGWCNNLQGPMGLFVGAGKGIIRSMYMTGDYYADFVPADYAINAFLLATWYHLNIDKKEKVFNVTASSDYNFTWEELINTGKDVIYNVLPFNGVVWYPGGSIKKTKWIHNLCFFFLQLIPAIFIDALLTVLGYKPILYQIQRRIQKGGEMFEYYTTKPWNFSNSLKEVILNLLNSTEKEIFEIQPKELVLKEYLTDCICTVRINNLKETDDTIPAAWRHMRVMWVVDKLFKMVLVGAFLYYTSKLMAISKGYHS